MSVKSRLTRNWDVFASWIQPNLHHMNHGGMTNPGGFGERVNASGTTINVSGDNNVISLNGKGGADIKKQAEPEQKQATAPAVEKPGLFRSAITSAAEMFGGRETSKNKNFIPAEVLAAHNEKSGGNLTMKDIKDQVNKEGQRGANRDASRSFVERSETLNWVAEKLVDRLDKWAATAKDSPVSAPEVKEPAKEDLATRLAKETSKLDHPWKPELMSRESFKEMKSLETQSKGIDSLLTAEKGNPERTASLTELKKETSQQIGDIQKQSHSAWEQNPAGYSKAQAKDYVANSFNSDNPDSLLKGIKGGNDISNPVAFVEANKEALAKNTPEAKADRAAQQKADRAEAKKTLDKTTHPFSEKSVNPERKSAITPDERSALFSAFQADPKEYSAQHADNFVANHLGVSKDEAIKLTEGMDRKQLHENPELFCQTHDKAFAMKTHEFKLEFLPKEQYKQVASLVEYAGGEKTIDKLNAGEEVGKKKQQALDKAMEIVQPHADQWKEDPRAWTRENAGNLLENTVGKGKDALATLTPDYKENSKPEKQAELVAKFQENPGKFVEEGMKHVSGNDIESKKAKCLIAGEKSIRDFFVAAEKQKEAPTLAAEKSKGQEPDNSPER